jgi:sulfate adenylyltransferase large subunit
MAGLLRICTAGSVDDGKSTLIGRLLYESRGVYEDQVRSVEAASRHRGVGPIDFSLFTDGLRAEREQGITIDVAYRYFATSRRKFILADTPGHEQYTRNMATGASTADLAILLVDVQHGARPQSLHHARIARLLGIRDLVLAVNKMDLVGFDRGVFEGTVAQFGEALGGGARTHAVPVSALHGDNVTTPSARTPWYDGPGLLGHLETVDVGRDLSAGPFRYPVQLVLRPAAGFRGYAGRIRSGVVRVGDPVRVWPSGRTSTVGRIVTRDGDLEAARAPMSVVLSLADDLDVSRGDVIASDALPPTVGRAFHATLVWMDERALDPARLYLLKHTTRTVTAEADRGLTLNAIGAVTVRTGREIVFDPYDENRATGSFVLIDPDSHFTAGAGMITGAAGQSEMRTLRPGAAERLAALARAAATPDEAATAVRHALEELLR